MTRSANKTSLIKQLKSFIKRKTSQKYRFNMQYENNKWDGLKNANELGRYSIIVGYVRFFCSAPKILDLGCGEGVLQQKFSPSDYSRYVGIDFSDVAIDNAKKLEDQKTNFRVGDLNHLEEADRYDAIIYNESLYYLKDPQKAIQQLFKNLNPGGVFIFSIVDKHGKEETGLWTDLNSILELQDRTKITNGEGNSWTVQVYKVKG